MLLRVLLFVMSHMLVTSSTAHNCGAAGCHGNRMPGNSPQDSESVNPDRSDDRSRRSLAAVNSAQEPFISEDLTTEQLATLLVIITFIIIILSHSRLDYR